MFDDVGDAVRGLVPRTLGEFHATVHRAGIKVWVGPSAKPPREHYEAQVIRRDLVPGAQQLAVEVGFHSEHQKESDNEAVITRLLGSEKTWRRELGREPVAGAFLGPAPHWRRLSEVWADPDLEDPEVAMEIGARLADYVTALEPHRGR